MSGVVALSQPQINRYKVKEDLSEQEYQLCVSYLDPQVKYDNLLEENHWELINSGSKDHVKVNLSLLKRKNLFFDNPSTWRDMFHFLWLKRHGKACEIEFTGKQTMKTSSMNDFHKHINKYVYYQGRVKRVISENVAVVGSQYICKVCSHRLIVDREWYDKVKPLGKCGCGAKDSYVEVEAQRRHEVWQSLSLQNLESMDNPVQSTTLIDCRVLCARDYDRVVPGQIITVGGILRSQMGQKAKTKVFLDLYSLEPSEQRKQMRLTPKKVEQFHIMATNPKLWDTLKCRVFPHIAGHSIIKDALLLQQVGGGEDIRRSQIHVLVSGDPGIGKSQILKAIEKSFGGVFTSGMGSTTAGLTATAYRDANGQWNLDGGAAVIANGGNLLLDEIDKLSPTVSNSLLQAMEQQTISVAKAGINVSLPSKIRVLAVGNPKLQQKFDLSSDLRPQIGLPPALLSRFDLVFVVPECVEKQMQQEMINSVLSPKKTIQSRNYIDYLKYVSRLPSPRLTNEVRDQIVGYYKEIKQRYDLGIGPRNLEGLIRLCTARGKVLMKKELDREDFMFVKSIYDYSIKTQLKVDPSVHVPMIKISKKLEPVVTSIKEILNHSKLTLIDLFLQLSKIMEISYNSFLQTVLMMQKEALIYKPDGKRYCLV